MARIRVYIKPFDDAGNYVEDYSEITDDVVRDSVSAIRQTIDGRNPFDIGVYKNSSISLTVRNDHGKFSDVGEHGSIFRYKRADSLVKITWDIADHEFQAFGSVPGELQGEEVTVFEGLLNDDSSKTTAADQKMTFSVLGKESIFDRTLVPFASLSDGDLASSVILDCLNQTAITDLLTVDAGNITLDNDIQVDSVSAFENKTVKEALDELLLVTNSVLYLDGDTIKVVAREATPSVEFTFYGQGSENGRENITEITGDRTGISRLFNFITWRGTSLKSENSTTIIKYGYRKKEIETDAITDNTRRQAALDAIKAEFGDLKREFELTTPLTYDVLELALLARVSIDYPPLLVSTADLPYYEFAEYEVAQYPKELLGFSVLSVDNFKIIGREINLLKGEVKFMMRKI